MIDLDRGSLDGILPATSGPADWDDVLSRFRVHRRRRRRRFVVLAVAALVVAGGTASAFGTVREFFRERGFVGLPPLEATPSAPESGKLVLSFRGRSLTGAKTEVFVYSDGRVIRQREGGAPGGANELTSGFLEQRLAPDGVDLLLSDVVSTGLFDHDRALLTERDFVGTIRARNGDRFVVVHWATKNIDPGRSSSLRSIPTLLPQRRRSGRSSGSMRYSRIPRPRYQGVLGRSGRSGRTCRRGTRPASSASRLASCPCCRSPQTSSSAAATSRTPHMVAIPPTTAPT